MDERYMRDGRRLPPRNSRGEFRRRRSRRDRGIPYEHEGMRMHDYGDVTRRGRYGDYGEHDMRGQDYGEHPMPMDGHYGGYGGMRGNQYEPMEFMGYCTGYAGSKEDYGYDMRGRGRDYGYDYRGGRGRGYDYGYDYDDYGDYGETLSEQELEKWNKKLLAQLDDREKQMFSKEAIMQKAKAMGKKMEGFGEKELYTTTLMMMTDYKPSIGANPEVMVKLAYDWLSDKDVAVKGAEKLAVYHDCIVEGEDD